MRATIALIACVGLVGCTHTVYKPIALANICPEAPILPAISETELQPLTDKTYQKLVARELALRQYVSALEINCERK